MNDVSKIAEDLCKEMHIKYCKNMNNGTYVEFDGYGHHAICSKHHFDKVGKEMINIKLF